jgi:hypothetical protein
MTVNISRGFLTTPLSLGNLAVNGLGFQPKLILFYGFEIVPEQVRQDLKLVIGAADDQLNQWCVGDFQDNASDPSICRPTYTNTDCLRSRIQAGIRFVANLDSVNSDGFVLDFTVVDTLERRIFWVAFGGDIEADVGVFQNNLITGAQSIGGVGFSPDFILFGSGNELGNSSVSFGLADLNLNQGFSHYYSVNGVFNVIARSNQRTNLCIGRYGNGTVDLEAALTSMDSDGFTLNISSTDGNAYEVGYAALQGIDSRVGSFNGRTGTTGLQAVAGVGFEPIALLLSTYGFPTSGAPVSSDQLTLGFGLSPADQANVSWASLFPSGSIRAWSALDSTDVISILGAAAVAAYTSRADISTFDSDGFTLNWSQVDATSREILYLALGEPPFTRKGGTLPLMGVG